MKTKKCQPSRFSLNLLLFVVFCALFGANGVRLVVEEIDELHDVLNLMPDHQVVIQNPDETEGVLPGLKLTATQTAFDYIEQKITPELINSLLATFTVPPINTTKDGVNVVISNVKAGNISFKSVDLAFAAGGIGFQISGATGGVTLDWQYTVEYVDLGDSGTGRVVVGDINFDLLVLVSAANGRPTVKVGSLSFTLGNLVIKLSGGASWFYDFFESLFNSLIVSEIQSAATSAITEAINVKAESLLESLPTVIKLPPNNVTQIDISLTSAPTFVPGQSVTLGSRGMITPAGNSQQPPYTPTAMPDSLNNQMIQILVGQYVLDTAAWAYFRSGILSYVITPNMIPAWFPVTLNTTSWEFIIPALYKEFPNCAMNLHFFVSQVPTIKFNAGQKYKGVAVNVIADFDVNVITKNNKVVTVFDLEVNLDLDFVVGFNGSVVHGQFYFVDFNVTIKNSTIGTFDVSIVQFLLNFVVNTLILQPLNAFLISEGIQIPTVNGITLATPTITYNNGYIGFTTDLKLVTPSIKMRS